MVRGMCEGGPRLLCVWGGVLCPLCCVWACVAFKPCNQPRRGAVLVGKSCALSCLGLQPHLTHPRKIIRARFRVLAIRLHPDKESHPQATEAFVKVRAAHDRLMASE